MIKISVEYVWLDAQNKCRSKMRVLQISNSEDLTDYEFMKLLPLWNFDGSSTDQATTENSEVILKPQAVFKHAFYEAEYKIMDSYFVICDCYNSNMEPINSNTRFRTEQINELAQKKEPILANANWFGFEQEYVIYDPTTTNSKNNIQPIGWKANEPTKQGKYYCSVGTDRAFGREIVLEHYNMCLESGIKICGWNAEVMPGQWEFQIGICTSLEIGDHLIAARYLLDLIAEKHNKIISYHPKPEGSDWNGSGCHINFSTLQMRDKSTGKQAIHETINKFAAKHEEHIKIYGEDNDKRLSGIHETSDINIFTYGVGDRSASIRIPSQTFKDGYGYIEDRRPAANVDPYLAVGRILQTVFLE